MFMESCDEFIPVFQESATKNEVTLLSFLTCSNLKDDRIRDT